MQKQDEKEISRLFIRFFNENNYVYVIPSKTEVKEEMNSLLFFDEKKSVLGTKEYFIPNSFAVLENTIVRIAHPSLMKFLGGYYKLTSSDNPSAIYSRLALKEFYFLESLFSSHRIRINIDKNHPLYLTEDVKRTLLFDNVDLNYVCNLFCYEDNGYNVVSYPIDIEFGSNYVPISKINFIYDKNVLLGIEFSNNFNAIITLIKLQNEKVYNLLPFNLYSGFNNKDYRDKLYDAILSIITIKDVLDINDPDVEYINYKYINIISAICIIEGIDTIKLEAIIISIQVYLKKLDESVKESIINDVVKSISIFQNKAYDRKGYSIINEAITKIRSK